MGRDMKANVRLEGLSQLNRALQKLAKSTNKDDTGKLLLKNAGVIRDRIRAKAPRGPTGNLKRSPVAKLLPSGNTAIAGVDRKIAPHAGLVEFGTSHSAPHPFFRPAIDESAGKVMSNLKDGIKKQIEGAV